MSSLGILEVSSIARGVVVADAMAKRAPVRILQSHPMSPGKHVVIVSGGVAEVEEAMAAGDEAAAAARIDRLLLAEAHAQLVPLLAGTSGFPPGGEIDSAAIVETTTVCATVLCADAAAKAADVTLRLGVGIGGKAFFTMTGALPAIQAAVEAARSIVEPALMVSTEIIPSPHEDLRTRLMW